MAMREYVIDDLKEIKKILKETFGLADKIADSQISGINLADKVWIQESPDFKGFTWAKMRGDKLFVKYFYTEKSSQLFNEMMFFIEEFARTNNLSSIFIGVNPAIAPFETMFIERSYELSEDPALGKMYHINLA